MDTAVIGLFGLGFLLGLKHALDADHIAAIATLNSNSIIKGFFWGIGHTVSLLVAGLMVLLFKITIPEKLALSFEFIVGIMLIVLGINALITVKRYKLHLHRHKHGTKEHMHFHSHSVSESHKHNNKPFLVGLIHGLAGSAALTLLVLSTISSISIGLLYILIFGIGSMIGMIIISKLISLPFRLMAHKVYGTDKMLRFGAGFASLAVGISIMYNTIMLF